MKALGTAPEDITLHDLAECAAESWIGLAAILMTVQKFAKGCGPLIVKIFKKTEVAGHLPSNPGRVKVWV
jgi:hypothetical protein